MAEILATALATDIAYCHGAFKWTFCDIPPFVPVQGASQNI